ncbi:MAG: helix-hairpin-helix domain-containing protein, partial [Bacteroidaceae bacterium]|nr:helix-hairpin-helix domain-containing protein [Bacteroidaceae bacterium]
MRFPPVFSKSDRRGLLLLEWMAILALVLLWAYTNRNVESGNGGEPFASDSLSRGREQRKISRNYTYAVPETPLESFPFDPNTADSTTLLRLGLAPWQVKAIYNYRARHGRYHTAEDFKRLPGMTLELWERLGKYVTIDKKYRYLDVPPARRTNPSASSSVSQKP